LDGTVYFGGQGPEAAVGSKCWVASEYWKGWQEKLRRWADSKVWE
jgi:hypothetical protein